MLVRQKQTRALRFTVTVTHRSPLPTEPRRAASSATALQDLQGFPALSRTQRNEGRGGGQMETAGTNLLSAPIEEPTAHITTNHKLF